MVKDLPRNGLTLQLLWEEYLREHPDGYQNSQSCHHFHRPPQSAVEVGMHIDHKACEKLFVDYAGDKLVTVDPEGGKPQAVETFVAVLGNETRIDPSSCRCRSVGQTSLCVILPSLHCVQRSSRLSPSCRSTAAKSPAP